MSTTLQCTPITHEYLIDLFYQVECSLKLAYKWRRTSLCPQSLRDAQLAVNAQLAQRRFAIDLAKKNGFDALALFHEAADRFLSNGGGEQ